MNGSRFGLVAGAAVGAVVMAASTTASAQSSFYAVTAADLNGPPGSVIRYLGFQAPLSTAQAFRVLYRSTGLDGKPIAVSGIIVAPARPPHPGGWPVIAWAHGTTGVAHKCAPSLLPNPVAAIPGISEMIERNFVVVATDYPGLGTPGIHPYLVGVSEGRAVLDSVRASRHIAEIQSGPSFAVWGHSQGGHASLWTGELAAKYAPDLKLVGVAAAAPATELGKLFEDDLNTLAGKILTGMVMFSWSKLYGYPLDSVVSASELPAVDAMGAGCIELPVDELGELRAEKTLPRKFLKANPVTTSPWAGTITANTPGKAAAGAPVYISQGTGDTVVDPPVTDSFVKILCGQGTRVEYVKYPNLTHTEIPKASAGQAVAWMADRLAGKPAPSNCGG